MNTMPCSNTAALQQHEASQDMSREEEAKQLADDNDKITIRAEQIAESDGFAAEVVCEIEDTWYAAIGGLSIRESKSIVTQVAVGRKILVAIKDAAERQARKELRL